MRKSNNRVYFSLTILNWPIIGESRVLFFQATIVYKLTLRFARFFGDEHRLWVLNCVCVGGWGGGSGCGWVCGCVDVCVCVSQSVKAEKRYGYENKPTVGNLYEKGDSKSKSNTRNLSMKQLAQSDPG